MTCEPAEPLRLDYLIKAGTTHSMTGTTYRAVGLRGAEIAAASAEPDELLWTAALTANQMGDHAAALAASQRLGSMLGGAGRPFLHAVSGMALGWASMIAGDPDGAIQQESASLEEFRGQDEPYWTVSAVLSVGSFKSGPVRTGVHGRLPAQPARGGSRSPGPARHRHERVRPRTRTRSSASLTPSACL